MPFTHIKFSSFVFHILASNFWGICICVFLYLLMSSFLNFISDFLHFCTSLFLYTMSKLWGLCWAWRLGWVHCPCPVQPLVRANNHYFSVSTCLYFCISLTLYFSVWSNLLTFLRPGPRGCGGGGFIVRVRCWWDPPQEPVLAEFCIAQSVFPYFVFCILYYC